jgi:hypothetical protein
VRNFRATVYPEKDGMIDDNKEAPVCDWIFLRLVLCLISKAHLYPTNPTGIISLSQLYFSRPTDSASVQVRYGTQSKIAKRFRFLCSVNNNNKQ